MSPEKKFGDLPDPLKFAYGFAKMERDPITGKPCDNFMKELAEKKAQRARNRQVQAEQKNEPIPPVPADAHPLEPQPVYDVENPQPKPLAQEEHGNFRPRPDIKNERVSNQNLELAHHPKEPQRYPRKPVRRIRRRNSWHDDSEESEYGRNPVQKSKWCGCYCALFALFLVLAASVTGYFIWQHYQYKTIVVFETTITVPGLTKEKFEIHKETIVKEFRTRYNIPSAFIVEVTLIIDGETISTVKMRRRLGETSRVTYCVLVPWSEKS